MDVDSFMLVVDPMRQTRSGPKIELRVQHYWEAIDFERGVAVINEENIIYGIRIKYVGDDGYDAGGLSWQGAYTLTLTPTLTLTLTNSYSHTHTDTPKLMTILTHSH